MFASYNMCINLKSQVKFGLNSYIYLAKGNMECTIVRIAITIHYNYLATIGKIDTIIAINCET